MTLRRLPTGALALALALVSLLLFSSPVRAQDPPEPVQITAGSLDWGVRASFRRYVSEGGITVSRGVTRSSDATAEFPVPGFTWPLTSGTYDPATKTSTLQFGGTVHFSAHEGALDLSFIDPKVVISGYESTLYSKLTSKTLAGDLIDYGVIAVGAFDLTGEEPAIADGKTTWSGLPSSLTPQAGPAFAGFYSIGTSLDPASIVYTGPGGKPQPAVETWDAPGSLKHERVLANPAIKATSILPDAAHGVVHVIETNGAIRALDPATLEPLGPAASITRSETIVNSGPAFDRVGGALFVQGGKVIRELRWNTGTKTYDVTPLPGEAPDDGQGSMHYNAAQKTLVRASAGVINTWKRTDTGWTHTSYAGAIHNYIPKAVMDDDGTVVVVSASSGQVPIQVALSGTTATTTPIPGTFADPDAVQPGQYDLPSEVAIGPGRTVMLGTYMGRVWTLAKDAEGNYKPTGPSVTQQTGNVLRSAFDPVDGTFLLAAYQGDALLAFKDGKAVGRTRVPTLGAGSTYPPIGVGVDADHSVYATSNAVEGGGLLKFKRVGFAPVVTTQPEDVTLTLGLGTSTATATFTAAGSGDGVTVKWQSRAGDSGRWTDIDGETKGTLTLPATVAEDGLQVRAVLTNAAGALATSVATLGVQAAPAIAAQPESLKVSTGSAAVFKVMPTGNPYPEIQWQRRDANGFWVAIDDADTGFLTIEDTVAAMSGTEFRARLKNAHGTLYSRTVVLEVETPVSGPQGVTGGYLDWGVKASFRNYIRGPVAHGSYSASGGAVVNGDGTVRFPVVWGKRDAATGETVVQLGGKVEFVGHENTYGPGTGYALRVTIANARVEIPAGGSGAVLKADMLSKPNQAGAPVVTYPGVVLASLDAAASPTGGAAAPVWAAIPAQLAATGVAPFAGFYTAGTELDPLVLSLTVGGPVQPEPGTEPPVVEPPVIVAPAPVPTAVPTAVPTPTPVAKPTVKAGAKRVKVGAARTATVATVTCATACTVSAPKTVKLRIGGRSYTATLVYSKSIKAGKSATVRVRLSSAAVKRLRGRSVKTSVRVVVTAGSQRTTLTVKPTLTR